jgi:uncharacterized protein (TIGR00251 family)
MKLTETKDGTIIEVYVKPNQSEFKIATEGDDIIIYSSEEPVKGRVNKEIVKELTKLFHVSVDIISGSTSKQKRLLVSSLTRTETEKILAKSAPAQ